MWKLKLEATCLKLQCDKVREKLKHMGKLNEVLENVHVSVSVGKCLAFQKSPS